MKANDHTYFVNTDCKYFPCHKTEAEGAFNCMFCYCPLYEMGVNCGGSFSYTVDGVKDCSGCLLPHSKDGYSYITTVLSGKTSGRDKNETH